MLSTKAKEDDQYAQVSDEILDAEGQVKMMTQELEIIQRRYLHAQNEKDHLRMRQQAQMTKGNVPGKTKNASQQLNMFTMDSERDVIQMKNELQETKDKLHEIESHIKQQESKQRELASTKSTTDRRLNTVVSSVNTLEAKNVANKSTDIVQ